ncbi:hypothetical protein COB55_04885 [Candidatus Wolfebacteria bacterium]|nr:MAG: hypothetical protein COB55_04885 [Candidatus Wolfebacteria bacterium]
MPSYPTTLTEPKARNFTIKAKKSTKDMKTDRFEKRLRKMTTGERYTGTFAFTFSCDDDRDTFIKFLKYDLSYGQLWFDANWLTGLGFVAGDWVFRFLDTKFKDSGFLSDHNYSFLMAPRSEIASSKPGLIEDTWPISEGGNARIVRNIVHNGNQVVHDGNDIVVEIIPPQVGIPVAEEWARLFSESVFTHYTPAITSDPGPQAKWYDIGSSVYKIGTGSMAPFLGAPVPDITVFGETFTYGLSGNTGGTAANAFTDDCESYGEIFTNDAGLFPNAQANIDAGILEYEMAGYMMIGNTAGPTIDLSIQFLDIARNILFEKSFPQYSTNDDEAFEEWRVSGVFPVGTRFIRGVTKMVKNNGAITFAYGFLLNNILMYRTVT